MLLPHHPALALLSAAAALACVGCLSGSIPRMTAQDAQWAQGQWPDSDAQQLESGRRVYISRCGGCHSAVSPAKLSGERWRQQVALMSPKAHLQDPEKAWVIRYLLTASRPQADPASGAH